MERTRAYRDLRMLRRRSRPLPRAGRPKTTAPTLPDMQSLAAQRYRSGRAGICNECLSHCEREIVAAAMRQSSNNQSQAARFLGLTPRSIYNKLRKHHLAPQIVL